MPDKSRVRAFIDTVVSGRHVEAVQNFYHDDASMQENLQPARRGLTALVEHEIASLQRIQSMHTHPVETFLIDGDHALIRWTFDIVDKAGASRRLEELALQRWRGDRIAEEQFFYDTATAWRPIEAAKAG